MRILMEAALQPDQLLSIGEVARVHAISRNHVMKVVNTLAHAGLLETIRGRGGGFRLGRAADEISLGDIVRITEPSLRPADCANCVLSPGCGLTPVLSEAVAAFLAVLDDRKLSDVASTTQSPRLSEA